MTKHFSTFIEDNFYQEFIAFYNSYRYYQHQTPLKVYLAGPLRSDRLAYLRKICTVIEDPALQTPEIRRKFIMKYRGLADYMSDYEICLDVDTIFLSNLDHLFEYMHDGKMLVAEELYANLYPELYVSSGFTELQARESLRPYLGSAVDTWDVKTPVRGFNGGFIGLGRAMHRPLLIKVIEILQSSWEMGILNHNEQYCMNLVTSIWHINRHYLPYRQYMNTWEYHDVGKIIKMYNGKLALYAESGEQIYFYHFTGGLGCEYEGQGYKCNPGSRLVPQHIIDSIFLEKFQNPVILIWNYFYNSKKDSYLLNMV